MTPDRTEFEWTYHPADFFEAPYRYASDEYVLSVEGGRAIATLCVPQDPVNEGLDARIRAHVEDLLLVRQLQIHRKYDLQGPHICQHLEGRRNVAIQVTAAVAISVADHAEVVIRDAAGNIVGDSTTERIAEHTRLLDSVTPKLAQSPELREMLTSYSRSIADPSNELLYLYEIRDSLSNYLGGEKMVRDALGISQTEWKRLGKLANDEPLDVSRHRGKHLQRRRSASQEELNEVRGMVVRWIIAFAQSV